jgi:hypothetical protein
MRRHAYWIFLGIAICSPAGCGPGAKVVDVTGKVTYNGNPPNEEGCSIVFLGPNGKEVVAAIAPSGEYKATGVVAGANQVAIYYRNPEVTKSHDPSEKTPPSTSLLRDLPPKYADVKTSELTFNAETERVFNVDMKGAALGSTPQKKAPKAPKPNTGKGKPHKT